MIRGRDSLFTFSMVRLQVFLVSFHFDGPPHNKNAEETADDA